MKEKIDYNKIIPGHSDHYDITRVIIEEQARAETPKKKEGIMLLGKIMKDKYSLLDKIIDTTDCPSEYAAMCRVFDALKEALYEVRPHSREVATISAIQNREQFDNELSVQAGFLERYNQKMHDKSLDWPKATELGLTLFKNIYLHQN